MSKLPQHYNQNTIVALVRDPFAVFVYWEVEADKIGGVWTLRLTYIETGAVADIQVDVRSGNYYASVIPGETCEVSLISSDGVRLTAEPVRTPQPGHSTLSDTEWSIPEDEFLQLFSPEAAIGSSNLSDPALWETRPDNNSFMTGST